MLECWYHRKVRIFGWQADYLIRGTRFAIPSCLYLPIVVSRCRLLCSVDRQAKRTQAWQQRIPTVPGRRSTVLQQYSTNNYCHALLLIYQYYYFILLVGTYYYHRNSVLSILLLLTVGPSVVPHFSWQNFLGRFFHRVTTPPRSPHWFKAKLVTRGASQ